MYAPIRKYIIAGVFLLSFNAALQAQLVPGDIAFSGYHSQGTDKFSFVLLKNLTAGTTIKFTDNAWLSTNVFRTGEGDITWTVPAGGLIAGREITIDCVTNTASVNSGGAAGTVTGTAINLNTSGDQVFAYTGTLAAPTAVIAGIHMNVYSTSLGDCFTTDDANWDGACANTTTSSMKPSGGGNLTLSTGVNSLWIGSHIAGPSFIIEWDNAVFNCSSVPASSLATVAGLRTAVNNKANWSTDNTNPSGFPQPANCNWLGLSTLPVKLLSFTGQINNDKSVTLKWKVADPHDAKEYIVEKSVDGLTFTQYGSVLPSINDTYFYTDTRQSSGKNYYRLKIIELTSRIIYSAIIATSLKSEATLAVNPNPVADILTIQQFGILQYKNAILTDMHEKYLQNIKLTSLQHSVNLKGYATGNYILKFENGPVIKILKQ
jgi:hypothetical protein